MPNVFASILHKGIDQSSPENTEKYSTERGMYIVPFHYEYETVTRGATIPR